MAKDVLIVNPVEGGSAKTNINRAREWVADGRAVFVDARVIRSIDTAREKAMQAHCLAIRTGLNYDHLVGQWVKCARHIPLIHPEKMRV